LPGPDRRRFGERHGRSSEIDVNSATSNDHHKAINVSRRQGTFHNHRVKSLGVMEVLKVAGRQRPVSVATI
jgi:hypothetical protein